MDLREPVSNPVDGGSALLDEPKPTADPASPSGPPAGPPSAPAAAAEPKPKAGSKLLGRRRRARRRWDAPAWVVSALFHVVFLGLLAAATFTPDVSATIANLNSALVSTSDSSDELVNIYNDPTNMPRDQAVGEATATSSGAPEGLVGIGSGSPSATPNVGVGAKVGEGTSLPSIKVAPQLSGLAMLPSDPSRTFIGGGGMISGDVTYESADVGVALDQVAREILQHLALHKLTVIWLFDESESMKDDQQAIKSKFDRVASELKAHLEEDKKSAGALSHAIVGFGRDIHYELEKPTLDVDKIGKAIDQLRVDDTGTENTLHAIQDVIQKYGRSMARDRGLLIVLVTDESGDDGGSIEEARQLAVKEKVPIYVIGRQSLFGYDRAHLKYVDPVTKDVYWPAIRRGPETADVELLQWDGLHERWDEQPSGFAPYELARLAKDTGGIYFLLPSEETMRVRTREKAYSIATLKEYVPDYAGRLAYADRRSKSELRRSLREVIEVTKGFSFRRHYPIDPAALVPAIEAQYNAVTERLNVLVAIEKRLRALAKARDREPEKRWQAHYDLMLAQVVAYQIKAYEYRACLEEMAKKPPRPKTMPNANLVVEWVLDHSGHRKAPKEKTEKVYAEAARLLKQVIERHPKTPWADLASDELARGLGVQWNEWHHNPKYDERAKLVPKY